METLSNSTLTLSVSPHGAELCSITKQGREYLWQADPAYWKRHSPVLFPIVGSTWNNEYRHNGKVYFLTQHGFARDMDFTLVEKTEDSLHYQLTDSQETLEKYPFHFALDIVYRLQGNRIKVEWTVTNTGHTPMHFQIGAHPAFYFPYYDASTTARGYLGFDATAKDLHYILISDKGCADTSYQYPLELESDGLFPLDTHTFDKDALILEDNQVQAVTLYDNKKHAHLTLRFNTPVVGLWSPPAKNAPFICIEPWYGRCDSVNYEGEYQDKDWMQHLQPREAFHGGYEIEIC